MASEQVRRENKSDEREIRVEKDMVPKMTSHFEALVVKERGGDGENVNMGEEKEGEKRRGEKGEGKVESGGEFEVEGEKGEGGEEQGKEGGGGEMRSSRMQGNEGGSGAMERSSNMEGKGGGEDRTSNKQMRESGGGEGGEGHSLEEISKYRQSAQQNSMESIRAAEERYAAKAKELSASTLQNVKESTRPVVEYSAEKVSRNSSFIQIVLNKFW